MTDDTILINDNSINNTIKVNQSVEKYGYIQTDPFTSSSFLNRFFSIGPIASLPFVKTHYSKRNISEI